MDSNVRTGSSPVFSTKTLVNRLIFKSFFILHTQSCHPFANHFLILCYLSAFTSSILRESIACYLVNNLLQY
nr:hypothetical protein [uncultured bacterium]